MKEFECNHFYFPFFISVYDILLSVPFSYARVHICHSLVTSYVQENKLVFEISGTIP